MLIALNTRPVIKSTGKKKTFKTGAKREITLGRGFFHLLSPIAIARVARICEGGALKYAERNWEKGMPVSSCINSAFRHLFKYLFGLKDEDHLAMAVWNLCAAMHLEMTHPELNDMLPAFVQYKGLTFPGMEVDSKKPTRKK